MALSKTTTGWIKRIAVAIAIVALVFALRSATKSVDITKFAHPGYLFVGIGLFLIHYFMQIAGWHFILRSLGLGITFGQSVRMWCSSLMARWIPGPFVLTVSRMVIAKDLELSVGVVAYGIVLEMALVVIGSVVTTLIFLGGIGGVGDSGILHQAGLAAAICIFLSLLVCVRPKIMSHILTSKPIKWLAKKVTKRELSLPDLKPIPPLTMLGLVAYYTCFWIYSGTILLSIAAVYRNVDFHQFPVCASGFAGSWFIGFLSVITPAGLGVRELALYLLMDRAFPKPVVVIFAVLVRLEMLLAEVLIVFATTTYLKLAGLKAVSQPPDPNLPIALE